MTNHSNITVVCPDGKEIRTPWPLLVPAVAEFGLADIG
jgi:hypothetical protein